ncbi:MAG: universal stress protein [Pricia sp.]|nr:universal stress protein [Pricia sp.]
MKNILVPTDFSKSAFHALRYSTELLKDKKCDFFLLNVYERSKGFNNIPIDTENQRHSDKLRELSKNRLNAIHGKIKKENKNSKHSYRCISEPDDLIYTLHSKIDELNIDMIVLGNRGEKSSIPVFLGSTVSETLKSIKKCPILVVPKGAELTIPKEIGFATDFKKPFNFKGLDSLRSLAHMSDAPIRIIHIDEEEKLDLDQKNNLDSLVTYFNTMAYTIERIPNFISKTKIIQLFLEKADTNMISMVYNEHGPLEKMLREPVVEKMAVQIDMPFLVLPDTD